MREILILPFGILPLVLLAAYLVWKVLEGIGQETITNNRRFGTTEFPSEVSALLCGTNQDELAFSPDGKSVILTIQNAYCELPDVASAKQYLEDSFISGQGDVNPAWADQLIVTNVTCSEQPGIYEMTITMPRSTVLSMDYIENEIKNLGRVFLRNTSNNHRWLLFPKGARSVEVSNDRVLVQVGREQLVPTFLGNWKDQVMSERQITRNIKNRLWNQVDVKCIKIDGGMYYGEIILPAASVGWADEGSPTLGVPRLHC